MHRRVREPKRVFGLGRGFGDGRLHRTRTVITASRAGAEHGYGLLGLSARGDRCNCFNRLLQMELSNVKVCESIRAALTGSVGFTGYLLAILQSVSVTPLPTGNLTEPSQV